jgi:hypothetical protein
MQKIESSWIIVNKKSWKKWVFEDASMKLKNYRLKQACSDVASNRDDWGTKHTFTHCNVEIRIGFIVWHGAMNIHTLVITECVCACLVLFLKNSVYSKLWYTHGYKP